MIYHHIDVCKRMQPVEQEKKEMEQAYNRIKGKEIEKQYVAVNDGRKNQGKGPTFNDVEASSAQNKNDVQVEKNYVSADRNDGEKNVNDEQNNTPDFQSASGS